MVLIGYEESSQLDVEPAKYFVLVTKREKRRPVTTDVETQGRVCGLRYIGSCSRTSLALQEAGVRWGFASCGSKSKEGNLSRNGK